MNAEIKTMSDGSYTGRVYYVYCEGFILFKAEDKEVCVNFCKENNLKITN